MAQLVIAAAGAAIGGALAPVGFSFLGLTGAQLGWMAGSMLGSALAPKNRSAGPRLDELRVGGTEYGGGIAWVAGAPRVAGDLIWASDRREIATTEEAGKGGGSSYTSYTYELDAMYLLADQPGAVVTRCWDNGKLIYTNLASADDASRLASEQASRWRRITVYDGADAQMPDPTYEAAVPDAPAYTRRLTVFIEGLQLGNSGTLPNLTFEVASLADTNPNFVRRHEVADTGRQFADLSSAGLGYPGLLAISPAVRVTIQDDTATTVYLYDLDGTTAGTATRQAGEDYPSLPGNNGGTVPTNHPVGMLEGQPVRCANHISALGTDTHIRRGAKVAGAWNTGTLPDLADVLPAGRYLSNTMPCSDGAHLLIMTAPTVTHTGGAVANRWHIVSVDNSGLPVLVDSGDVQTPRAHQVYGNCAQLNYSHQCGMLEDDLQHVWIANGAGTGYVEMLKIEPDGVMRQRSVMSAALLQYGFTYPSIWAEGSFAVVASRQSYQAFRRAGDVIEAVPLQDVVEALCERATMPAGTYDASGLAGVTQPVRALAVTGGNARQALEILQVSHGFDAFVTDKLYFVPRGGAPVLTIDADDLAAGDGDALDQPFALTVNADLEIPGRIAVTYRNMAADQINGTEQSERGPTGQDSVQAVQLAIGMQPAEARGVADAMVRDAYAARLTSTLSLPLAYTRLTPTDVVQVPDSDGTLYRMRITRRSDSGGVIALEVVGDDGEVVVEEMATSADYTEQTTVQTLASTVLVLLDIPLLRDADDGTGMYLAARGNTSPWPGCIVYRSNDGGASFAESVADISDAAVLGETTSVLANWSGCAIFDRTSSVLVDMGPGQLSSATGDQLQADAELNALLVGSELVRFGTAALQSTTPNIYRISGLLRGQRGTEWAMGTHAVGEPVVLLRARGLRRIPLGQADLGQLRYFKAVTRGALLADASPVSIVPYSVLQKPLAPVDLRGARDADGNITLSWKRRTRVDSRFFGASGSIVPLGEASERYELEIVSGASVVRTAAIVEPSYRYTTSMQTSDFGGLQGAVSAKVYQLGANGRGYPLAASVGAAGAAAIVRTITLGGAFTVGLTINVRSGSLLLAAYLTKSADVNLTGVATAVAAAITAGPGGYAATSSGAIVTVTGPLGVSYTLTVDVTGDSSVDVRWYVQQSVNTSGGTPYNVRVSVAARVAWGAGGTLTAGTVLGFALQVNGTQLPAVQYRLTYEQSVQVALTGLMLAFQGSTTEAAGYQLTSNSDAAGFHLRLTRTQVGYVDAAVVDRSTGSFFIVSSLATAADQGTDPVVTARPQISDVTIYGTPQTGEVYRVELGPNSFPYQVTATPTNYDYTAIGGDTAASVASGLATVVDAAANYLAAATDRGLGGAANTTRITGALTVPTAGGMWSVRAFIQRAITASVA